MTAFNDHWRSADGLTLHARDYPGSSPAAPVVCIHGLTRNARDFEDLAPVIVRETGRRVLAVTIRGRAGSERAADPARYNPGVYAGDVLALLDDLKIGETVLIGTSMGGRMGAAAPDMALAEAPGVGHAPMLDEPEAVSAILALLAWSR